MTKRPDRHNPLFLLDNMLALSRQLESENLPALRMQMGCGHLETPLGDVPIIVQTPFPAPVRPTVHAERTDFARFGVEQPWPAERRALLETLQALVDAPIVCLEEAFMRFERDGNECILTVGTWDKPGWTNQDHFPPAAFDYLAAMAPSGGCLVDFVDRATARPRKGAGDQLGGYPPPGRRGARACDARPSRERLILLLAIHLHMGPAEISKLNLAQVRKNTARITGRGCTSSSSSSERRPSPMRWSSSGSGTASPTPSGTPRNRCSAPPQRLPRGARCGWAPGRSKHCSSATLAGR